MDLASKLYYKQYDLEYEVRGNSDTVHNSDRPQPNLYFNPVRRAEVEHASPEIETKQQRLALQAILDAGYVLDDDTTIKRNYNWFKFEYDEADRKIISFSLNDKKIFNAKRAAEFFANSTLRLDETALEAHEAYGFREEQEKYFNQMKGQMGFDRQRNWSEEGKSGRLFILFVALIISSFVRHIWKSTELKDKFGSMLVVLDEMRSICCIEHTKGNSAISPRSSTTRWTFARPSGLTSRRDAPRSTDPAKFQRSDAAVRRSRRWSNWRVNCTK